MSTSVARTDEFEWDNQRLECLELLLKGVPKLQIAKRLSVHRNTINNWTGHPAFMNEANARMIELRASSTFKRTREAGLFADIAGRNAIKAAAELDKAPDHEGHRRRFRDFTDEWRRNTQAEREILGINVQRVESRVISTTSHTHQIGGGLKELLLKAVKSGSKVIDVKAIENAPNPLVAIQGAVRALLSANDGEMLNKIHAEDKEAETAAKE